MRYLLALLLVVIALPCYAAVYYVDGNHPNAANDTPAHGYSADSPWITPSYAAALLNNGDTLFIYNSDTYYPDYMVLNDAYIFVVGVDSPVFTRANGTCFYPDIWKWQTIDGIVFRNCAISIQYTSSRATASATSYLYVKNCIFDSGSMATSTPSAIKHGARGSAGTYGAGIVSVENCVFSNQFAVSRHGDGQNGFGTANNDTWNHCTVKNSKYFIFIGPGDGYATNTLRYTNCIIDVDTLIADADYGPYEDVFNVYFYYGDTYLVGSQFQNISNLSRSYAITTYNVNMTNVDPLFISEEDTYGYMSNDTLLTSGIDSGIIGVLWGYYEAPVPAPSTSLQYLYRGMNLMQRFEIIRRR